MNRQMRSRIGKSKNIGYIIHSVFTEATDMEVLSEKETSPLLNGLQIPEDRTIAMGTLQDADRQNRNGRIYMMHDLMTAALKSPRLKELIDTGNLKGENGHPLDSNMVRQMTIDPNQVCVKYLKLWQEGKKIKAIFCGTNNDKGEYFDKDLKCGERPSFSARSRGTLESKGGKTYATNLGIVTWDRVYYPSHDCAYTEKILKESGVYSTQQLQEAGITDTVIPIVSEDLADYLKHESANIYEALDNIDCFTESTKVEGNQVRLITKEGDIMYVRLEDYVLKEMMNFVAGGR